MKIPEIIKDFFDGIFDSTFKEWMKMLGLLVWLLCAIITSAVAFNSKNGFLVATGIGNLLTQLSVLYFFGRNIFNHDKGRNNKGA